MVRPDKLKPIRAKKGKPERTLVDESSDDEEIAEAEMFEEEMIDYDLINEEADAVPLPKRGVKDVADDEDENEENRSQNADSSSEEDATAEEDSDVDDEYSEEEDATAEEDSDVDDEYSEEEDATAEEDSDVDEYVEDMDCEQEMAEEWRAGFAASSGREPRMWDKKSALKKIELTVGDRFETPNWFRIVLRIYSGQKRFNFTYTRNQKKAGIGAVCKEKGCPFYIWCGVNKKVECLQITNLRAQHWCTPAKLGLNVTTNAIAWRFRSWLEKRKKPAHGSVQDRVLRKLNVKISRAKAYRVINKAKDFVHEQLGEQYGMLKRYGDMVMKTDPNSRFVLVEDDSLPPRFKRLYIRYGAQKLGFKEGCRPFIGVDGCHLKGYHGGIVLSAVAMDANNGMFPLALAVVEAENKDSWSWFVEQLFSDLELGELTGLVVMSDKQKGLIEVLSSHPEVEHRHCMRHLFENWYKSFKSYELKKLLWKCSRSTSVELLEEYMDDMKQVNEKAYCWLQERPPQNWCKAFFKTDAKVPAQTNNISESFNAWISKGRELPIMSFLEFYRKKLMSWFYAKGTLIEKCGNGLCPRIDASFDIINKQGLSLTVQRSDETLYEVEDKNDTYIVDVSSSTCTCLEWQLSGIPCKHAVASIFYARGNPKEYVHEYYSLTTMKKSYQGQIFPIAGIKKCRKLRAGEVALLPPIVRKQPGRPRVRRIKGVVERQGQSVRSGRGHATVEVEAENTTDGDNMAKPNNSRKGMIMKCRKCGKAGHNRRTCSTKDYGVTNAKSKSKAAPARPCSRVLGDAHILAPLLDKKRASSESRLEKDRKRKQLKRAQQATAEAENGQNADNLGQAETVENVDNEGASAEVVEEADLVGNEDDTYMGQLQKINMWKRMREMGMI